jgi:hypothetical protein
MYRYSILAQTYGTSSDYDVLHDCFIFSLGPLIPPHARPQESSGAQRRLVPLAFQVLDSSQPRARI